LVLWPTSDPRDAYLARGEPLPADGSWPIPRGVLGEVLQAQASLARYWAAKRADAAAGVVVGPREAL